MSYLPIRQRGKLWHGTGVCRYACICLQAPSLAARIRPALTNDGHQVRFALSAVSAVLLEREIQRPPLATELFMVAKLATPGPSPLSRSLRHIREQSVMTAEAI